MKVWIGATFPESEKFTMIGWKVNEILYYWRGEYWRWTRSPMVKDDPQHVFEKLTDEHKEGWHLNSVDVSSKDHRFISQRDYEG